MKTLRLTAVIALALAASAVPVGAHPGHPEPVVPYDGQNPFNCDLQQLGTGTSYPDPKADPLCVEYDKTQQNVTDLGIVEFLSREPARFAAAGDKCFYYQHDHWTGSIVQGESPELWHWDGGYFFDRARGVGGVYVENVRMGGQSYDPRQLPIPEPYRSYFGPNGGGGRLDKNVEVDRSCVAKVDTAEEAERVYRKPGGAQGSQANRCHAPRGSLEGRQLGPLRLGITRARVVGTMGAPLSQRRGYQRYCLVGGGSLKAGYRSAGAAARDDSRVGALMTTNSSYAVKGVRRGTSAARMRQRLTSVRKRFSIGSTSVYEARRTASRRLFVAVRRGKVRYLAIADPRQVRTLRSARSWLARAG